MKLPFEHGVASARLLVAGSSELVRPRFLAACIEEKFVNRGTMIVVYCGM